MFQNYDYGSLAEAKFITKITQLGFKISLPINGHSPYDIVVDNGKKLIKVQIKSTRNFAKKRINHATNVRCRIDSKKYSPGEIDFLAVYVLAFDRWYIFPYKTVSGRVKIDLYPNAENTKSRFERYCEKWEIFR